jgi:hypothetical protein
VIRHPAVPAVRVSVGLDDDDEPVYVFAAMPQPTGITL